MIEVSKITHSIFRVGQKRGHYVLTPHRQNAQTDLQDFWFTIEHCCCCGFILKQKAYYINLDLLTSITDFLCKKKQHVILDGEQLSCFNVASDLKKVVFIHSFNDNKVDKMQPYKIKIKSIIA